MNNTIGQVGGQGLDLIKYMENLKKTKPVDHSSAVTLKEKLAFSEIFANFGKNFESLNLDK